MSDTRQLPVPDGLDGMRVDAGLSRLLGLSRTTVAALAEDGCVAVDGRAAAKSDAKRSALRWRDSAAEAGHVLEYSTAKPSARCRCPSASSASIDTGYRFHPR